MAIEILSYSLLKDVALLVWRKLGRRPTATESARPAPRARVLPLSDLRRADVPLGCRAAVVDDERVQAILKPGRYRGWQLRRLRRRFSLSPGASLAMWRVQPERVRARLDGIFARDSHEFEAEVTCTRRGAAGLLGWTAAAGPAARHECRR